MQVAYDSTMRQMIGIKLPVVDLSGDIWALQRAVSCFPQIEPKTRHFFADGMYCREVSTDANVTIVGKVHKREHFYMVVSGTVWVTTDDGVKEIVGPQVLVSKPGTKRAVFSVTPSVRLTVHRTDKTDLAEIEKELLEDDPTAMFDAGNKLKSLGMLKAEVLE